MYSFIYSEKTQKIESIFMTILLLELFIGGSGRVFSFGIVTLRMILFSLALGWFGLKFIYLSRDRFIYSLLISFIVLTSVGWVMGYMNNAPKSLIFTDIKQLIYFFSMVFFTFFTQTREQVTRIASILKIAVIAMSLGYLLCYLLLRTNTIPMEPFYHAFSAEWLHDEFMFRGTEGNFFYKGFFYLGIGIFFFIFGKPTFQNGLVTLLIYTAIFLTLLRWLLAVVLFVYALTILYGFVVNRFNLSFIKSKENIFHYIMLSLMIIIPFAFKNYYVTSLGNKSESVDIRKQQFYEVKSEIFGNKEQALTVAGKELPWKMQEHHPKVAKKKKKPGFNIITGVGFGIGVPIRPVHMELSYLEIIFKQGILGLVFWFFIFFYCVYNFQKNIVKQNEISELLPWIAGVFVVYLQSITNPLLINSIGMSFVIMALLIMRKEYLFSSSNNKTDD